jgi:hypothetical protein
MRFAAIDQRVVLRILGEEIQLGDQIWKADDVLVESHALGTIRGSLVG